MGWRSLQIGSPDSRSSRTGQAIPSVGVAFGMFGIKLLAACLLALLLAPVAWAALPQGNAVKDPEAILRNALPIDAPQLQDLQHRLESTSDDLRAKRWKPLAGAVTRSQSLLTTQRSAILERFSGEDRATATELLERLVEATAGGGR
jgi:hypothetical protein